MDTSVAARPTRSRGLQFNLRTSLVAIALFGLLLSAGRLWWNHVYYENHLRDALLRRGAEMRTSIHQAEGVLQYVFHQPIVHIESVWLEGPEFTDEDLTTLVHLKHLQHVTLVDTGIRLATADRLAAAHKIPIAGINPAVSAYAFGEAIFYGWHAQRVDISTHRAVLDWQLACASLQDAPGARELAYQQCLSDLRQEAETASNFSTSRAEYLQIAIAQVAMERQIERGDTNAALKLGRAWEDRARALPALTLQEVQANQFGDGMYEVLAAMEISTALRMMTATLNKDRRPQAEIIDDMVRFGRELTEPLRVANPSKLIHHDLTRHWKSRLVVWLTAQQIARDEAAGATISEARDRALLRLLHERRHLLAANAGGTLTDLDLNRRLEVAIARRHPALANAEQAERVYDYRIHHWAHTHRVAHGRLESSNPVLLCVLLRRQLERRPAVYQWTQHELNKFIDAPPANPSKVESPDDVEDVDWQDELESL